MNNLVVGIIPDGHRRYSKVNNVGLKKSYTFGVRNLFDSCSFLFKSGFVREVVIYFLSSENLKRSKSELKILLSLFKKSLRSVFNSSFSNEDFCSKSDVDFWKDKVKICFVGRRGYFDKDTISFMKEIEDKTCSNSEFVVNIAVGYGGKQELVDCFNKINGELESGSLDCVDEKVVAENLYFKKDIDFVVRSGFNKRLSNFFCWQTSYSDLFFLDKFWPDVTIKDFENVLSEVSLVEKTKGL